MVSIIIAIHTLLYNDVMIIVVNHMFVHLIDYATHWHAHERGT